jgi:hypothetical protein
MFLQEGFACCGECFGEGLTVWSGIANAGRMGLYLDSGEVVVL